MGPEAMLTDGLPFFIAWDVPEDQHPGRMPARHRSRPGGMAWVELGGDRYGLAAWLGGMDVRRVGGARVRRVRTRAAHCTVRT